MQEHACSHTADLLLQCTRRSEAVDAQLATLGAQEQQYAPQPAQGEQYMPRALGADYVPDQAPSPTSAAGDDYDPMELVHSGGSQDYSPSAPAFASPPANPAGAAAAAAVTAQAASAEAVAAQLAAGGDAAQKLLEALLSLPVVSAQHGLLAWATGGGPRRRR